MIYLRVGEFHLYFIFFPVIRISQNLTIQSVNYNICNLTFPAVNKPDIGNDVIISFFIHTAVYQHRIQYFRCRRSHISGKGNGRLLLHHGIRHDDFRIVSCLYILFYLELSLSIQQVIHNGQVPQVGIIRFGLINVGILIIHRRNIIDILLRIASAMHTNRISSIGCKYLGRTLNIRGIVDGVDIPVSSGDHILHLSGITSDNQCRRSGVPAGVLLLHIHITNHVDILDQSACLVISGDSSVISGYVFRITKVLSGCKVHPDVGWYIGIAVLYDTAAVVSHTDAAPVCLRRKVVSIDHCKVLHRTVVTVNESAHCTVGEGSGQIDLYDHIPEGSVVIRNNSCFVTKSCVQFHFPVKVQIGNLRTVSHGSDKGAVRRSSGNSMSLAVNLSIEIRYDTVSRRLKIFHHHEFSIGEHHQLIDKFSSQDSSI